MSTDGEVLHDDESRFSVLIVEDHELLSQSLSLALRSEGVDIVVVHPSSSPQVLDAVRRHEPAILLLDLDLGPGIDTGESLVPAIIDLGVRVLVVTGTTESARIGRAVEAGAEGFVHKSSGFQSLLDAVLRMADGQRPTDPAELRRLGQKVALDEESRNRRLALFDRLTGREKDVLSHLMDGTSVDQIAADNVVSVATVRTQVRGVLTKLGVNSQLAAVVLAHRLGWGQTDDL